MDINNQFDQELLSAYLDDALSATELEQVERWLASDPTATAYLTQLRSNRHTLQAMASLPGMGLKSSLAERVLAQALATQPVDEKRLTTDLPATRGRSWWAWGALAATAAAVGWLAILPLFNSPRPNTLLPDVAVNIPGQPEPLNQDDLGTEPAPEIGIPRDGILMDNSRSTPEQRHQPTEVVQLQLIFVGDVVMSESAWQSGKFDQLLDAYGIHYEKELVASQGLIEGLIESQTIAGPDADPNSQQEAALVYVDCPAVALSKLIVKLQNDGQDFVDFNFNMAMGGGGFGLPNNFDKLLKALGEQSTVSPGRGTARLIVPEPTDALGKLLPKFEATKKKTAAPMLMEAAAMVEAGIQSRGNQSVENQNGQMLLILRKQQ